MRNWRSWLVAACVAVAGCSDSASSSPDARVTIDGATAADGGTLPDGGVAATFAAEVVDLIVNQTADNTQPVAVDFASTDSEDPGLFNSLF